MRIELRNRILAVLRLITLETIKARAGLMGAVGRSPVGNLYTQIIRSLVVSVIAFLVDFGFLVFLKEILDIHYLVASVLSFCLGVVVNYILSVRWVFNRRKINSHKKEFLIFIAICSVGLGLNTVIIGGMVQFVGADYRVSKLISTVVVFFWNFIVRKKILY